MDGGREGGKERRRRKEGGQTTTKRKKAQNNLALGLHHFHSLFLESPKKVSQPFRLFDIVFPLGTFNSR